MQLQPEIVEKIISNVPKRAEHIPTYRASAVLMLFFNRDDETHLVYIRRPQGMRLHSGNMAFPGGKIDPEDETSYATAARETFEEIGVSADMYQHLGDMGFFKTLVSRFDAIAHSAWCFAPPEYLINAEEVDEVVEIPLRALQQQFRPDLDFSNEEEVRYLSFRYQPGDSRKPANLWGLTARITHHFLQGLQSLQPEF